VGHRELGSGGGVATGRVHDDDTAAGGSRQVDVVDAGTSTPDELQVLRGLQHLSGDLGATVHARTRTHGVANTRVGVNGWRRRTLATPVAATTTSSALAGTRTRSQ
jgi:hypothetical protein